MSTPTASTTSVARDAGAAYRQLDYWRRCGVFAALESIQEQGDPGSGRYLTWAPSDARVVGIVSRFARAYQARPLVEELTALVAIAARHATGFAVRVGAGHWQWVPMVDAFPAEPMIVVPLDG